MNEEQSGAVASVAGRNSRWKKVGEDPLVDSGPGYYRFVFRDDSPDPGDWCVVWSLRGEKGATVRWYHDHQNRKTWPPEFDKYAEELMERWREVHMSALERLAEVGD
jgi:hypothetical protein